MSEWTWVEDDEIEVERYELNPRGPLKGVGGRRNSAGNGTPALRNPSFRLDRRSQYSQDAETRKPDPARGRSAPTVPDRLRGLFKASSQ